jgi:hypothetical protein
MFNFLRKKPNLQKNILKELNALKPSYAEILNTDIFQSAEYAIKSLNKDDFKVAEENGWTAEILALYLLIQSITTEVQVSKDRFYSVIEDTTSIKQALFKAYLKANTKFYSLGFLSPIQYKYIIEDSRLDFMLTEELAQPILDDVLKRTE